MATKVATSMPGMWTASSDLSAERYELTDPTIEGRRGGENRTRKGGKKGREGKGSKNVVKSRVLLHYCILLSVCCSVCSISDLDILVPSDTRSRGHRVLWSVTSPW